MLAREINFSASEDRTTRDRRVYAQAHDLRVIQCNIPRPKLSKKLISIVDDDEFVRAAMEALVLSLGYKAAVFASAREYLLSDRVRETACLISDLQMPDMSGADLHAWLIADGYRIPIIFVTAARDGEIRTRLLNDGALEVLCKPPNERKLIACLDEAIKSWG